MKTIITNATVEIELPEPLDLLDWEMLLGNRFRQARVKLSSMVKLKNVVVRFPGLVGKIGELGRSNDGTTVTIKTLLLESIQAVILPELDANGNLAFFSVEEADAPIVVSSLPCPTT